MCWNGAKEKEIKVMSVSQHKLSNAYYFKMKYLNEASVVVDKTHTSS